jgi:DNA-binding NtrC family response regulator
MTNPGRFYQQRAAYERAMIQAAICEHRTHTAAAKGLGLNRTYMLRLMRKLGLSKQHSPVRVSERKAVR